MRRLVPMLVVALAACADSAVAPGGEAADFARIKDAEGSHGGAPYMAVLTPEAEFPGPGDPGENAGGVAVFTLNHGQEEMCFKVSYTGLSAPVSDAHIHNAPAGASAPPVIPLGFAFTSATSDVVASCVTVSRELIKRMRENPENYYLNIHTRGAPDDPNDRPGGAIRGQLFKTQGSNVNHF